MREFEIKKFRFKDMQKIAETFTQLDLGKEQLKEIFDGFVTKGPNNVDVGTKTKIEKYLKDNFSKDEIVKIKNTMSTPEKIKAYIQQHASQDTGTLNSGLVVVVGKLITVVGAKFDVILDFMEYFIVDITKAEIEDLDGEEAADALKAVFTNKELVDFFTRMFS
jgi:hypothetical protein